MGVNLKSTSTNNLYMNKDLIFPNDVYIFDKNGDQIDPQSSRGQMLIKIFEQQKTQQKKNDEQTLKWIETTFPGDKKMQEKYKKKFGLI